MNEEVTKILAELLAMVVMVLITGYILPAVKSFINEKVKSSKENRLWKQILKQVEAAEQMFVGSGRGKEKLEFVFSAIDDWLSRNGETAEPDEVTALIESAVFQMNKES